MLTNHAAWLPCLGVSDEGCVLMKARTFSSVSGQSRRPFLRSRTKWGSPIAFLPKVTGDMPDWTQNASMLAMMLVGCMDMLHA